MKYSIRKSDVIKAIASEPLKNRGWFHNMSSVDDGKCEVCAVGAVLRATSKNTFNHADGAIAARSVYSWTEGDVAMAYAHGNFLSILSTEFEHAADNDNIELARFHAINVAEAMCPDVLEFEV